MNPADRHDDASTPFVPHSRTVNLVLAGAIGLAFVGFFVGIRGGGTPPGEYGRAEAVDGAGAAGDASGPPVAVRYRDLPTATIRPNAKWGNHLDTLARSEPDLFAPSAVTEEQQRSLKAQRAARRAYDGAPPVIPHPIDQQHTAACLACHETGATIGDRVAPRISHAAFTNCTQCHVESSHRSDALRASPPPAANSFAGLAAPDGGARAWIGAPPVIPHRTFMRENCASCHGPHGTAAIRTTHPWRNNCVQCHAPNAMLDQSDFLHRIANPGATP